MYVNPFIFGIIVGCLGETIIILLWAYIVGRRKK